MYKRFVILAVFIAGCAAAEDVGGGLITAPDYKTYTREVPPYDFGYASGLCEHPGTVVLEGACVTDMPHTPYAAGDYDPSHEYRCIAHNYTANVRVVTIFLKCGYPSSDTSEPATESNP